MWDNLKWEVRGVFEVKFTVWSSDVVMSILFMTGDKTNQINRKKIHGIMKSNTFGPALNQFTQEIN
jgi:hypothetical protein